MKADVLGEGILLGTDKLWRNSVVWLHRLLLFVYQRHSFYAARGGIEALEILTVDIHQHGSASVGEAGVENEPFAIGCPRRIVGCDAVAASSCACVVTGRHGISVLREPPCAGTIATLRCPNVKTDCEWFRRRSGRETHAASVPRNKWHNTLVKYEAVPPASAGRPSSSSSETD